MTSTLFLAFLISAPVLTILVGAHFWEIYSAMFSGGRINVAWRLLLFLLMFVATLVRVEEWELCLAEIAAASRNLNFGSKQRVLSLIVSSVLMRSRGFLLRG